MEKLYVLFDFVDLGVCFHYKELTVSESSHNHVWLS